MANSRVEAILGWVKANAAVAITLAGALIYGVKRFFLVSFYNHFGLAPEEIGFSYAQLLGDTAATFGMCFLAASLFGVVVGLGGALGARSSRSPAGKLFRQGYLLGMGLILGLFAVISALVFVDYTLLGSGPGARGTAL